MNLKKVIVFKYACIISSFLSLSYVQASYYENQQYRSNQEQAYSRSDNGDSYQRPQRDLTDDQYRRESIHNLNHSNSFEKEIIQKKEDFNQRNTSSHDIRQESKNGDILKKTLENEAPQLKIDQKVIKTQNTKEEKIEKKEEAKAEEKSEKKGEDSKDDQRKIQENKHLLPDNFFTPENLWKTVTTINWLDFFIKVFKIVVILICFSVINKFTKTALNKHIKKMLHLHKSDHHDQPEHHNHKDHHRFQLAKTIFPIIESVITWALGFLTLLMMAQQLGLDTAPIYGSVLALGFGFSFASQNTIKDIINGLFTLFDGNISVGDYVKIGDKEGYVESMSLRAIVLRYQSGSLQLIPFSQASSIMNCTREFTNAELIVTVGHDANFDDVVSSYHASYNSMKEDKIFSKLIKSELSPVVILKIDHWGIDAKSQVKISPDPEGEFSMEFYKKLLSEFRKRKIPLATSNNRWGFRKVDEDAPINSGEGSEGCESVNMDGSEEESEE